MREEINKTGVKMNFVLPIIALTIAIVGCALIVRLSFLQPVPLINKEKVVAMIEEKTKTYATMLDVMMVVDDTIDALELAEILGFKPIRIPYKDKAVVVNLGQKLSIEAKIYREEREDKLALVLSTSGNNPTKKAIYYRCSAVFFDSDKERITSCGIVREVKPGKPEEFQFLGSCSIYLPAEDVDRIVYYQIRYFEGEK